MTSLILGLVAGALFFGGLRRTVEALPRSPRPLALLRLSSLLRLGLVAGVAACPGALEAPWAFLGGILATRWREVQHAAHS